MTADLQLLTARVLELAGQLSGHTDAPGLETLCLAAVREYADRLRPGVTAADCAPALISACACAALSGLAAREGTGLGEVSAFRIGEVSVSAGTSGKTVSAPARADTLRAEAERLMAPYVESRGFAFLGVDG